MSSDLNDQFSSLLNSLHSSSIQAKDLPSSPINEENLFVWQPVPFTKLTSPENSVISVEPPPSIPPSILPPILPPLPQTPPITTPPLPNHQSSSVVTFSPSLSSPPSFLTPPPYYPHSFVPDYYSQSFQAAAAAGMQGSYPPSIASQGSYPIKYFAHPNFQNHPSILSQPHVNEMVPELVPPPTLPQPSAIPLAVPQKEDLHLKTQIDKQIEKSQPIPSSLIWFLYVGGFLLILVLVFTALWYFYVKDYNKYKLKKKDDKKEEEEEDEGVEKETRTLLPPPSIIQENFLNEIDIPNLQSVPDEDLNEAETLIKEESSSEEEYFEPKKILEFLEKKKPAKKSYFDLSDVDSSEFIPQPIEKKIHTAGKLSDESPEVNEYAEKRANSLK
jgi:hypothetical protein